VSLMRTLKEQWNTVDSPFLILPENSLRIEDLERQTSAHLRNIRQGDVVALVGDFDAQSISDLLTLIEKGVVLVPLSAVTSSDHEYYFETAYVDWIVSNGFALRRNHSSRHSLLDELRDRNHAGLILFSTGTTGRPKAILHDMTSFLYRFKTPRPTMRTLSFLQFDHIGGINTLFHTLFNRGVVVVPPDRSVNGVLRTCKSHDVEVLPATPTFLRMMLLSGLIPADISTSLKVITYGTERMDQPTLSELCRLLPSVDFRQTYGMSELGILRVKSESRNSLFMKVGGEGVETRIENGVLKIRSKSRMLGYLNSESPFDADGWYDTHDIVELSGEFLKVIGRTTEVINVGGLKFMASEVERVALGYPGIAMVQVIPRNNPVTGQHCELTFTINRGVKFSLLAFRSYLKTQLPSHMMPLRIQEGEVAINHRFKKA